MSTSDTTDPSPGWPQRALQTLTTPAGLDFWARRLSPAHAWQRPMARVVGRASASEDAVTLILQPNRYWRGMHAGQHVNLAVEVDGRRLVRSYSPSPLPGRPQRIAVTVKRYADGRVSRRLCEHTRVGDWLPIGQAFGSLQLGDAEAAPRLMLAAGSGITPLMAMIRQWAAAPRQAALSLGYWARRREELCYIDELRALARGNPLFKLRFLLTGQPAAAADEGEGRIDAAAVEALLPGAECLEAFACGPDTFVARSRELLDGRVAAFHCESFTPPAIDSTDAGSARITLARRGQTVEVPRGKPLLSALEALGVEVIAGCRRGICHSCACIKRAGASRDLRDGSTSAEPASALQLCVNAALGDLILDL